MPFDPEYHEQQPTREEVDRMQGPVVVEFGADWCPICQGFAPKLEALFEKNPDVTHVRAADGRGKPLGRSFGVKLWPTLVFMRDGQVVEQMSRPSQEEAWKGFEALKAGRSE